MHRAIKPFLNSHTKALLNPGDPVVGYSSTELDGLARDGLIGPASRSANVGTATTDVVRDPAPVSDASLDVPRPVAVSPPRRGRTLRSAIDGV